MLQQLGVRTMIALPPIACKADVTALFDHLVAPRLTDGFAFLTFQKNGGAFRRLSGFATNRDIASVAAIVGTGAMTTFDYIAIGVLIVLGVSPSLQVLAASSGYGFSLRRTPSAYVEVRLSARYDRPVSPQRDKDVKLNSVAALPSGETSHSCSSSSVLGCRPLTPSKSSVGLSPLPFVD